MQLYTLCAESSVLVCNPLQYQRSLTVKHYSAEPNETLNSLKRPEGFFHLLEDARLALGKGVSQPESFTIRRLTSF